MRRWLGLAAGFGLVWCGLIPGLGELAPEPGYDCAGAPDDLVFVGRLVAREHRTVVEAGSRVSVRVDRFVVDEVLEGEWTASEIELETSGFVSPIQRHRIFVELDPDSFSGGPVRDRVGAGWTRFPWCGGDTERGLVMPANLTILLQATPMCTWIVVVSTLTLVALAIDWLRRRRAAPLL